MFRSCGESLLLKFLKDKAYKKMKKMLLNKVWMSKKDLVESQVIMLFYINYSNEIKIMNEISL